MSSLHDLVFNSMDRGLILVADAVVRCRCCRLVVNSINNTVVNKFYSTEIATTE